MEFPPKIPNKSNAFCSVRGCRSKCCRCPQLSFHTFPKSGLRKVFIQNESGITEKIDIRRAWEDKLGINKATNNMVVCSLHFTERDYFFNAEKLKKRRLRRYAIPSVNIPVSCQTPVEPKLSEQEKNERSAWLTEQCSLTDESLSPNFVILIDNNC